MAKAEVKFKTEMKEISRIVTDVREVKEVEGITLTLNPHEARVLRNVLRTVGGCSSSSLRGVVDRVNRALESAGVGYYVDGEGCPFSLYTGSLYFKDGTAYQILAVEGETLPEPEESYTGSSEDPRPTYKVGDKVRVVRKVKSFSDGWDNSWESPDMDRYINNGKVYTISRISNFGVRFEEDDAWGWPVEALEKVDLTLRVGARILITNPWNPQGYDKGDVLTVRSVTGNGGVHVSDARYPFDYPGHVTGAYVARDEFVVIG